MTWFELRKKHAEERWAFYVNTLKNAKGDAAAAAAEAGLDIRHYSTNFKRYVGRYPKAYYRALVKEGKI